MKRFTAEEVSSDEDEEQDSDDEHLYFEERLDPAEDMISEENVAASLLSSPAPAATLSPSFDARTGHAATRTIRSTSTCNHFFLLCECGCNTFTFV
ncbi:hypothetical protein Q7C36_009849 [Tachysurus vachellii]|uniref:Uncharacterized protein n=1 Tax=Tachysurus vachellii TaxID=175792 RepID=A0AA88N009_TACVA|nr:hypothetical protein Q7C36_009849 [Tachysurus vachellii]